VTDDEREDAEALRWYVPAGQPARDLAAAMREAERDDDQHIMGTATRVESGPGGIEVTVKLNGHAPAERVTSGQNELARHRPTRYALMMRRRRANAARKNAGAQQYPAILPGDCATCEGLGVVDNDRRRCPLCHGSGMR